MAAQTAPAQPSPLRLVDVVRIAGERRAEIEVARLEALARALVSDVRGAEAMVNTSLALDAGQPVPPLAPLVLADPVPEWASIKATLPERPELAAVRAEITRGDADVQVMRDMYRPMAMIRTGPAYTMAEGRGWMAMVGGSLPIWRGKGLQPVNRSVGGAYRGGGRSRRDGYRDGGLSGRGLHALHAGRAHPDPRVGGLWSCMLLTLLVLPAAYAMWRRGQVRSANKLALTELRDVDIPPDTPSPDTDATPRPQPTGHLGGPS